MSASASRRSTSASSATSSPRRAAVSAARARAAAMRCSSSGRSPSSRRQSFSVAAVRSRSAARAAPGLGVARLGRLGGRAAGRDGGRARSASSRWPSARSISAAASACSVSASRCERGRPLLLGLGALGVEHDALAVQASGFVVGRLELVARGDQLLLGRVDLLLERARFGGSARDDGRAPRPPRTRSASSRASSCSWRAATSLISRRGASRPLTPRPPSTMAPRSVSPSQRHDGHRALARGDARARPRASQPRSRRAATRGCARHGVR